MTVDGADVDLEMATILQHNTNIPEEVQCLRAIFAQKPSLTFISCY